MTVCIAGINYLDHYPNPLIIAVCDRKVSFAGGYFSAEGVAMKIVGLNPDWSLMFAGDVSPITPLVEAMKEELKKASTESVRKFARRCSEIYRQERPSLLENEVLADYEIYSYADYLSLKTADPVLYTTITAEIKQKEENWSLLFAGFDKKKNPHVFVVTERGKIQYCDVAGFAAIGSGHWRSLLALSSYPFKRNLPFSEAVFSIAAAKFAAESEAEGVGDETIIALLEPKQKNSPVMSEIAVIKLRRNWRSLPRFPKDAAKTVWEEMERLRFLNLRIRTDSTLKRFLSDRQPLEALQDKTLIDEGGS